jgi:hypothetical protein
MKEREPLEFRLPSELLGKDMRTNKYEGNYEMNFDYSLRMEKPNSQKPTPV